MTRPKRILIVDDDDLLRKSLSEQLAGQGFSVADAATGAAGRALALTTAADAILLDIGLPDIDGRLLCRQLRQAGVTAPVIMLTAADSEDDTVAGLEAGANDYVAKPFRMGVLLARLRAHLRQHEHSDDAVLTVGPYRFHPAAKQLVDGRRRVRLTEKEAAILKYLYRAGGEVVSREVLLGEVWGYNPAVNTHTLETHIYRLRQKIETDPASAALLLTEPGGYRLAV